MVLWEEAAIIGLSVTIVALALAMFIGSRRQQGTLTALVEALVLPVSSESAVKPVAGELDDLPPPVGRYLRHVLPPQGARVRAVRLAQVGMLRTGVRGGRWMPFEASHVVAPPSTGFVWDAKVRVAPFLHVRVRDTLISGRGSGQVSLLSALTVAADCGTPEMNSGSLHRFLAEAVWYPTALLPSAKLRWSGIDENRALATLTDNGVTVSLEFRFNDIGEASGIFTPARWGSFDGAYKQVPWEGHFRHYEERRGMRIPVEGEVGWYLENEWQPVWKGRITNADYEMVR